MYLAISAFPTKHPMSNDSRKLHAIMYYELPCTSLFVETFLLNTLYANKDKDFTK